MRALDGLNLSVPRGAYLSISGVSGSGKSTLMHILGLLDRPTTGNYQFDGVDTDTLSANDCAALRGREIGFVFQSFRLLDELEALENVALPLTFAGVGRKERLSRAAALLEAVGLYDRRFHHPNELSGGQQQRVAIARALAAEPSLLLADEPTGNLDPVSTQEVLALFDRLHDEGRTIILITHDRAVAARAQTRAVIENGRLIE